MLYYWRQLLKSLFYRPRRRKAGHPVRRPIHTFRPQFEILEDRVTPAFNLLLTLSTPTANVSVSTVGTVTTFEAIGSGATLDFQDVVNELVAGRSVIISTGGPAGEEAGNIDTAFTAFDFVSAIGTGLTLSYRTGTGGDELIGDMRLPGITSSSIPTNQLALDVQARGDVTFEQDSANLTAITLSSTNGILSSGIFTLDGMTLSAQAFAGIDLITNVSNVEAQTNSGDINILNTGDLTVGGVGGLTGVTVLTSGHINLMTKEDNLTINEDVITPNGTIILLAGTESGGNRITNNADIINSGDGNDIILRADDQDLAVGSSIIATGAFSRVNLRIDMGGVSADLGSSAPGFNFTQVELNTITAPQMTITASNGINISASITLLQVQTLQLETNIAGGITETVAGEGRVLTVANLALNAATGIGAADDLNIAVTQLAFIAPGTVNISNSSALTITSVGDLATSSSGGGSITASSPVVISADVTHTANFTYTAGNDNNDPGDSITINNDATVTLNSAADASLSFFAGDDIRFGDGTGSGRVVTTGGGTHTVRLFANQEDSGSGDGDDGSVQQVDNSFTAVTGQLLEIQAGAGIGTASQPLRTAVSNLEAETETGGIFIANSGALTVGGVSGLTGLQVTGASGDIELTNDASVALDEAIDAGAGTVRLVANGNITQNAAGTITAATLGVRNNSTTSGTINLSQNNDVDTVALFNGFGTGFAITFVDSDDLTVGSVAASGAFAQTDGATVGGNGEILLQAGGALTLSQAVHSGASGIALISSGNITQAAAGTITGGFVALRNNSMAAGNITLDQANDVDTIAAFNSNLAGGNITFNDSDDLNVGSTPAAALGQLNLPAMDGVSTNNGSIDLTASNALTLGQTVAAGGGQSATLTAGTTITQTSTGVAVLASSTSLTAPNGIGTMAQSVVFDTTNLTTDSSANNGDQFLDDPNTALVTSLKAGTGVIALNRGTFNLAAGDAIADASGVNLLSSATLNLNGEDETIASLAGVAGTTLGLGANTLTTGNAANTTFSGVISGAGGGLIKQGAGTFTLDGDNSYTGTTTVNDGTLLVNAPGNIDSDTTVNNGATLGGTGDINGTVTVNADGTLSPGTSPGILRTGDVMFVAGSNFDVEINGTTPGTEADQLDVTGTVSLGGATLALSGTYVPDPSMLTSIVIINNEGVDAVTGTFAGLPEGSPVVLTGSSIPLYISYSGGDGNDVVLSTQPVVNGTPDDDTLVLRQVAGDPTMIEFSLNGAVFVQVTSALPLTFDGRGGTDLLYIDTSNDDPIPTDGVKYTGEILRIERVTGAAADAVTVAPGAAAGAGTASIAGFGDVSYTGVTNVDLVNVLTANVQTGSLDDDLTITDSTTASNGGSVPGGYSTSPVASLAVTGNGGTLIPSVGLHNVTTANLSTLTGGGDGNDTVTIAGGTGAHGVTNLTLETGAGTDTVTVTGALTVTGDITFASQVITQNATGAITADELGVTAGGAVTLGDAANDVNTLAVSATGLVEFRDADDLTIGAVAAGGGFAGATGITSGGGDIVVTTGGNLLVDAVIIDAAGGNIQLVAGDDLTMDPTASVRTTGAGTVHLEIDADGADPGTGGTATFSGASVDAPAGAVVKGNDDDDVFQFSPSPTTDIDVQAGAGVNTLLVDDSASLVADNVDLTATAITGSGFLITYSAVGGSFGLVSYTAGQGDDTIRVLQKGGDQVIVNGSGGNDLFLVVVTKTQPPTGIEVDGEAGFDRLRTQDNSGGAIIRNRKTGPGQGIIQVSYARQPISAYLYRNIEQVLGINLAANYIQALHHHIFGRDARPGEVAHWTVVLNRRGRLAVVRALEYAAEGRTFLVRKWFQLFFGRTPTAAQVAPFVRALLAGQSEEVVLGRLLGNPRAPYRPAVRRRLVRFYFQDLLRRNPTPRELAFWVNSNFRLQAIRQLIEVSRWFYLHGL